jgi:hypothetical protein
LNAVSLVTVSLVGLTDGLEERLEMLFLVLKEIKFGLAFLVFLLLALLVAALDCFKL